MNLKNLIAVTLLFFVFSYAASAQEKYSYATVTLTGQVLSVSTENDFTETKINKDDFKKSAFGTDFGPLLKKVNEMGKEGWEVYNNTDLSFMQGVHIITYYLKKKN